MVRWFSKKMKVVAHLIDIANDMTKWPKKKNNKVTKIPIPIPRKSLLNVLSFPDINIFIGKGLYFLLKIKSGFITAKRF